MSEPGTAATIDPIDPIAAIEALREQGAQRFDPLRFRQLEALARRAELHGGDVRQVLDRRLATLLSACGARFEQARAESAAALADLVQRFPGAAAQFERLQARGEFKALRALAARLEALARRAPLAELLQHLERQSAAAHGDVVSATAAEATATEAIAAPAGRPTELKALRHFRSTWTRLAVDRQLSRSLAQVPENPGPLNSQLLVLRALRAMQEISPAYLERFVSYVEALSWLDRASGAGATAPAKLVGRDGERKRKTGRGKAA